MKKSMMMLTLLLMTPFAVSDTLVRDGATCDIPDGYNSAPYSKDFNGRGMGDWCVFPALPWVEAFKELLDDCSDPRQAPPELPECQALVFSPNIQEYPCYEVRAQ